MHREALTSEHVPPSQESGKDAEDTSSLLKTCRSSGSSILFAKCQAQERKVQHDEERKERNRGPGREQHAERCEDEPAPKVQGEDFAKVAGAGGLVNVRLHDPEGGRKQNAK